MMGPTEPLASGVIAYNGDSERGWNDPPTLSFTAVTGSKKGPKLDLRKRVSHQEALTGRKVTSPPNPTPQNLYKQGNNQSNGLSNLALQQTTSQQGEARMPPPSISPCHSRHSSGSYTPPLLSDPKGYGAVPPQYPNQGYLSGKITTPGSMVPPTTSIANPSTIVAPPKIFSPVGSSLESDPCILHPLPQQTGTTPPPQPPVTTAPSSNLGKPLFSFPSSFNMVPIASALDTSHVRSNPVISPDTSPQTDDNNPNTNQIQNFYNTNMVTQGPLIFTPSRTSADSVGPLPVSTAGKRSPILNRIYKGSNGPKLYTPPPLNNSGRNSPAEPTIKRSPTSTPTGVHSVSNSPRSSTPENGYHSEHTSRHNSAEFDSEEGMKVTIEAIEETIVKCSDILKALKFLVQAREVEDVKKKVGIMQQLWIDGKLSMPVQITMKLLTKALLDGDTDAAHKLHLKLMVDYVGEVKQWMVAIKRLISAMVNINSRVS